MRPKKLIDIRYSNAVSRARHLVIAFDPSASDQRKTNLDLREWINDAKGNINKVIHDLARISGDVPRFVIQFEHSRAREAEGRSSWAEILNGTADHHKGNVRVLIRFSQPEAKEEQNSPPADILPSHLIGLRIGSKFEIETAKGICNLAICIPKSRESLLNFLTDIAADIFLFHHFASISLGTGTRPISLPIEALRAFSEEKVLFARQRKLKIYGLQVNDHFKSDISYVSFASCMRASLSDDKLDYAGLISLWEDFFDALFPKIYATSGAKNFSVENLSSAMAESLLSLTKLGGQISKKKVMTQIQYHLSRKVSSLVFCFVHRKAPLTLRKAIGEILGRRCKVGTHAVISSADYSKASRLSPYIFVVRLYKKLE